MSTKINARSPFYLSYTEPTVPTPTFNCTIAGPTSSSSGESNKFDIDQAGVITLPLLDYGQIDSISSSDSGFDRILLKIDSDVNFTLSSSSTFTTYDGIFTILSPIIT